MISLKDPVCYLKENGWHKADFIFISRDSKDEYKDQELDWFYDHPIHIPTIKLVEESNEEAIFTGNYIIAAAIVGPGQETPAITKEDSEVRIIFRKCE